MGEREPKEVPPWPLHPTPWAATTHLGAGTGCSWRHASTTLFPTLVYSCRCGVESARKDFRLAGPRGPRDLFLRPTIYLSATIILRVRRHLPCAGFLPLQVSLQTASSQVPATKHTSVLWLLCQVCAMIILPSERLSTLEPARIMVYASSSADFTQRLLRDP